MNKKIMKEGSDELCQAIVEGMLEKKAQHVAIIHLKEKKNAISDFFVVASATSDNHADAIADSIEDMVTKRLEQNPWHREGKENKEWILLDYVDVVAHIFRQDRREFFELEKLWGDVKIDYIEESNN